MIKIDENDPIGEVDPSFPYRDVVVKKNTDMKEFYDLQKEIGRGKFGTVYRCTEKSTGLKLAAKFIGISKRQDRRNAEREVEIMRELQHPRLIQMYDAFEMNNIMCVVLELIEGGELFERVIDDDFILTEKSVSVFMRQICEGIAFIHSKNILHLDMKPENILCLTKTGNRIKIIDFGLARKYDPEKKLQVLFGTPEFVAPEVVNFDSIGFGTDMWSVGVICYVLLSGLSPFMGETDVQTMANVTIAQYDFDDEAFNDISVDAKDFIGKLLLKDRERRMSATECLSHRWLQRRKPPVVSSAPPPNPISQSELDLQKDSLRYLVDRWNNDTNITLVVNNDDDKCDKVIDICKMNGIVDQQSKSIVCQSNCLLANEESTNEHPNKLVSMENTLIPIQCVEAPPVSNQELKALSDVTSTDRPVQNLKRSLSPDTINIETSKKEQNAKISKSLTPSTSGSTSPAPICTEPVLNGDEPSPKLSTSLRLEISAESLQNESSKVEKSLSISPKPSKKKTLARTPSPSIKDQPIGYKDESKSCQEEISIDKSNQKLPKSPSSLELPKILCHQTNSTQIKKSPSTSPKPLKRSLSKTPSPSIKDQPHEFVPINVEIKTSQETPKQLLLEIPENSTHVESPTAKKSLSQSPKLLKRSPSKTPSPSIKDQPDEFVSINVEITSSQEIPKQSLSEISENSTRIESPIAKKSPSPSPKPLKTSLSKTPSPSIKDQPYEFVPINVEIKTIQETPEQLLLEIPENSTRVESPIAKKSPSQSPKPLKRSPSKTPSPSIKNQPDEFIPSVNVEITSSQEVAKQPLLEIPENSSRIESATTKKSPSQSPKLLKKKSTKTPSLSITDKQTDKENDKTKLAHSITPEKSPQRDIVLDGKKSSTMVSRQIGNSVDVLADKFQAKVVEKRSSPISDAKICDILKQNSIVDNTSQLLNSKHIVSPTVSTSNLIQDNVKTKIESSAQSAKETSFTANLGVELAQGIDKEVTEQSNDKLHDIPSTDPTNQPQPIRKPIVEISDETYEYVKKRRFTIKSVESTKTVDNNGDSTTHVRSTEKTTIETSPQTPPRRSIFSPDVSPKVLRKLNDFVSNTSTSELMKRRISDIGNLLTRTEKDIEQSIPDEMSFCSKLNRIVRLRHDSYSIDGSSNYKRPKFRISYFSRDVPFASTTPLHADLLNYLPFGDESAATPPVWSFRKNSAFHSDPSSLRNSPERFPSPSLTKKLLSKFFNDSLDYDIPSTPSTSTNGLPKDKITGIIS